MITHVGSATVEPTYAGRHAQAGDPGNAARALRVPSPQSRVPTVSHTPATRSEEHTSELQSLMRISYAVFCLKKKTKTQTTLNTQLNSDQSLNYNNSH